MSVQHKDLAAGRWASFPFATQMANIGSEVERALKWKELGKAERLQPAYARTLELVDLTLVDAPTPSRTRELTLLREALVDFFDGPNQMGSSPGLWRKYFDAFTYAARKNC